MTMLERLRGATQRCLAIISASSTSEHTRSVLRRQLVQLRKFEEIIELVPTMAESGPCRRLMREIDELLDHLECTALKHTVH